MQRKIAIIGKINDVKSFMQTYKDELKVEDLATATHSYHLNFFTTGVAFYQTVNKDILYTHLSLRNPNSYKPNLYDKNLSAVIMVNPTDSEIDIVNEVKIDRADLKLTIPFLPVIHTVGHGISLDVKRNIEHFLNVTVNAKLKSLGIIREDVASLCEEDAIGEGIPMTVFSQP